MKATKSKLAKIKNELLLSIIDLESRYSKEYHQHRLDYCQKDFINFLLNYLKRLEYHYRDDVNLKPKNKTDKEYKKAMRLFKKYATAIEEYEYFSDYKLKDEYTNLYKTKRTEH